MPILRQLLQIANALHRLIAGLGSYFKQAIMASMLLTTFCRWKLINALPGDPVWHWRRVACVVFAMNMIDLTLICTQPQSKYNLYFACVEPNEYQVTYCSMSRTQNSYRARYSLPNLLISGNFVYILCTCHSAKRSLFTFYNFTFNFLLATSKSCILCYQSREWTRLTTFDTFLLTKVAEFIYVVVDFVVNLRVAVLLRQQVITMLSPSHRRSRLNLISGYFKSP